MYKDWPWGIEEKSFFGVYLEEKIKADKRTWESRKRSLYRGKPLFRGCL